jgi:hypothetical protein
MKWLRWASLVLVGLLQLGCKASMSPTATAKAGSMARFIVHGEHLYALDGTQLRVYATQDGSPRLVHASSVRADAETLFPHGDYLFVGTQQGMLIYGLEDPEHPRFLGEARHVVSCDPVVVEHEVAYVTLRSGSTCRGGENALLVFDVADPRHPRQIARRDLGNPHGLGIDGGLLFVADKTRGILMFDVRDPTHPRLLGVRPGVAGYDVIADSGILYVSADEGLYQYTYDGTPDALPVPLSLIPIGPASPSPSPPDAR